MRSVRVLIACSLGRPAAHPLVRNEQDLQPWLVDQAIQSADVVAVGFQEIVELNAQALVSVDASAGAHWKVWISPQPAKASQPEQLIRHIAPGHGSAGKPLRRGGQSSTWWNVPCSGC